MISSKPCFSSSVEREKKLSPLLAARTILQCIVSSGSAILAESRVTLSISQQPPLFSHLANIKMGIYYPLTNFRVKCPSSFSSSSTCQWTMSVAFIFPWTISFPAIVSQCMAWLDRFFCLFVGQREKCAKFYSWPPQTIPTICNWGTAHDHLWSWIACVLVPSVCAPVFRVKLKRNENE